MIKKLKIWWLKRQLRNAYYRATAWMDHMDCGREIAGHIHPGIAKHEQEFNRIADRLCELGEPVPTGRFPK